MLHRRDRGKHEQAENQLHEPAAEGPADASSVSQAPASAATTGIAPAGLSWNPVRQAEDGRARSAAVGEESLIGPDDYFSGNYKSNRAVRVQGRVEGSIESRGQILIEERAQVRADLAAEEITVAGTYDGKVQCRRRFEIRPTGVVTGEINTDLLVVQEGGYFDGQLKMKERPERRQSDQRSRMAARPEGGEEQPPAQV